ncbi:hypothetical protein B7494_g2980 [Chlorociboria aeruginascens]|nr:hypothetical protein B7494_g2980 [Chlorociboria aeruginascens]
MQGSLNFSNGIIFDIIQCLIQRNFNYATNDIRVGYATIKATLYERHLTKVILILHSQGGIEGGMIIDWLLQEVPQDLLWKLEVYTFGNAANHFNNPHLNILSENAALKNPTVPSTTRMTSSVHYHAPLNSIENGTNNANGRTDKTEQARIFTHRSPSGKAIRYIEHYAHTGDFVACWGVLNFIRTLSPLPSAPRFMGRVFERQGGGHQFVQHYMDSMFPLQPNQTETGFRGTAENNEFMNSVLDLGNRNEAEERESYEISYCGTHGEPLDAGEEEVLVRDMSPVSLVGRVEDAFERDMGLGFGRAEKAKGRFRVKDLSRLWLYRDGRSPKKDEVDAGIARMSTI